MSQLPRERIVAVGLLTQRDVELLGHGFSRLWPLDDSPCFADLVKRIDEADEQLKREWQESGQDRPGKSKRKASLVPGGGRY